MQNLIDYAAKANIVFILYKSVKTDSNESMLIVAGYS